MFIFMTYLSFKIQISPAKSWMDFDCIDCISFIESLDFSNQSVNYYLVHLNKTAYPLTKTQGIL